jgi:hypothetical protein
MGVGGGAKILLHVATQQPCLVEAMSFLIPGDNLILFDLAVGHFA